MTVPILPPRIVRYLLDRMWDGGWNEPEDRRAQTVLHDYLAAVDPLPPLTFTSRLRPPCHVWTLGDPDNERELPLGDTTNLGLTVLHLAASAPRQHVDLAAVAPGLSERGEKGINALRISVTRARSFIRKYHPLLAGMLEGVTVRKSFTAIYDPYPGDPDIITQKES